MTTLLTETNATTLPYKVADMSLADWGRREMNIALIDPGTVRILHFDAGETRLKRLAVVERHGSGCGRDRAADQRNRVAQEGMRVSGSAVSERECGSY